MLSLNTISSAEIHLGFPSPLRKTATDSVDSLSILSIKLLHGLVNTVLCHRQLHEVKRAIRKGTWFTLSAKPSAVKLKKDDLIKIAWLKTNFTRSWQASVYSHALTHLTNEKGKCLAAPSQLYLSKNKTVFLTSGLRHFHHASIDKPTITRTTAIKAKMIPIVKPWSKGWGLLSEKTALKIVHWAPTQKFDNKRHIIKHSV